MHRDDRRGYEMTSMSMRSTQAAKNQEASESGASSPFSPEKAREKEMDRLGFVAFLIFLVPVRISTSTKQVLFCLEVRGENHSQER